MNEKQQRLRELVLEYSNSATLHVDSTIHSNSTIVDLCIDSLDLIDMIVRLEAEFDIDLSTIDVSTYGEMYDLLGDKPARSGNTATRKWIAYDALQGRVEEALRDINETNWESACEQLRQALEEVRTLQHLNTRHTCDVCGETFDKDIRPYCPHCTHGLHI